jgi:glycine cleavage system pyridoxal-binding protein P
MLEAIGVASVDELFEDIPEPLRLGRPSSCRRKPETEV